MTEYAGERRVSASTAARSPLGNAKCTRRTPRMEPRGGTSRNMESGFLANAS